MLIRSFKLKNIKEYEENNRISLLDYILNPSITGIVTFISLGNGCCELEEADRILDEYTESGGTLDDLIIEITKAIFGEKSLDSKAKNDTLDITEYKTLTDIFSTFYWELKKLKIGYAEFWDMSTTELYRISEVLEAQMINEFNNEIYKLYIAGGFNGQGVWGKLPPKVPQVSPKKNKADKLKDNIESLKRMGEQNNKKWKGGRA